MRPLAMLLVLALGSGFQGATFAVRGVCAIDDRTVDCWDASGLGLPELATDVRRRVEASSIPLSFVPGRKNRYVVVDRGPVAWLSVSSSAGPVQSYDFGQTGGAPMSVYRVSAVPGAAWGTLTMRFGLAQGDPVDIRLREGARATVDGVPLEIGKVRENTAVLYGQRRFSPLMGERWSFPVQRGETTPPSGFSFEAIGRDGRPIWFVDTEGRPVDQARGEAYRKELTQPGHVWTGSPTINYATVNASGFTLSDSSSLVWVGTSIDPAMILKLRVRRVVPRKETIGPFALQLGVP